MSTIITRIGKGTPLTNAEVDANFTNLNNDKIEAADTRTLTNKTISGSNNTLSNIGNASLTNSSITFGSTAQALGSTVSALNGVSIGGTTRAAGSFTTLDANGNVVLGDATSDTISANGRFNTDVVPSTDNARDLGTAALKWKQVHGTEVIENGVPVVVQTDIGTAPNEIPLNQYLGNLAYQDAGSIAGPVAIGANTTSDALRITQTGTGNCLVVEDSTSPDSTPFVIDADGRVIQGHGSSIQATTAQHASQIHGGSIATASKSISYWGNFAVGPEISLTKSRGSIGSYSAPVLNNDPLGQVRFWGGDGTSAVEAARIRVEVDATPGTGSMPGRLVLSTTPSGSSTPVERMRIDSAGNVGIGTSSPTERLTVNGSLNLGGNGFFYSHNGGSAGQVRAGVQCDGTNQQLVFATATNERMRIDSSGQLLVGTTSASGKITSNAGGSGSGLTTRYSAEAGTSAGWYSVYDNTSGPAFAAGFFYNGFANQAGQITYTSTTVTYATSSDYRLKENIVPMTGALAKVAALKPCTYTWKSTGEASQGFIAHELAEVCPDAVTGEKDAVDAEGKPVYQGIDTSFVVPLLTAALQEAVAEINALKARLDAANL
jgi:hypothetical protein